MKLRTLLVGLSLCFSVALLVVLIVNSPNRVNNVQVEPDLEFHKVGRTMERSEPTLKELLKCQDRPLEKSVEQRGSFIVFRNYIRAQKNFRCYESITLTAPGDYRFLDNIIPLVERWSGPISVALYSPGYDFFSTLDSIAYLRNCASKKVKEQVTFHLFFDQQHLPTQHSKPLIDIYEDKYDCKNRPPYETMEDHHMYKERQNLTYPINVARNVAKLTAQTHFVFPSDIELYPTKRFVENFLEFIKRNPHYVEEDQRNVYVLPLFEIIANKTVPESKTALQGMLAKEEAFLFHKNVCKKCHSIPNLTEWIDTNETQGVDVFTTGKREGPQKIWEPFFVCTHKEPLWDERLNWEGQGNKMCQAYYLCSLHYNFHILDNAFLIHKPGVKKKKVQNILHQDQQVKNNKILKEIANEIITIHGKNPNCLIHNIYEKPKVQTVKPVKGKIQKKPKS